MHQTLRRDLTAAMKARDAVRVAALRLALAALADAEAVPLPAEGRPPAATSSHVAGSAVGVGAAEVPRRELSGADVVGVVRAQADELASAAREYERVGRPLDAQRLLAQADVLLGYLPAAP